MPRTVTVTVTVTVVPGSRWLRVRTSVCTVRVTVTAAAEGGPTAPRGSPPGHHRHAAQGRNPPERPRRVAGPASLSESVTTVPRRPRRAAGPGPRSLDCDASRAWTPAGRPGGTALIPSPCSLTVKASVQRPRCQCHPAASRVWRPLPGQRGQRVTVSRNPGGASVAVRSNESRCCTVTVTRELESSSQQCQ